MTVFPIVYDRPTGTGKGPQPGAVALMAWCLARWAVATDLGIFNPRNVRGGDTPSAHSDGSAIDVGFPYTVSGTVEGWDCANTLRIHARELGVQQIIYARKIWRNTRAEEGWRNYAGVAAHYEHVHAELTRQAARELTAAHIASVFTPPVTEDPDTMIEDRIIKAFLDGGRDPKLVGRDEVWGWRVEAIRTGRLDDVCAFITWTESNKRR